MQFFALPASLARVLGRAAWPRRAAPRAVTTVMLGPRCLAVRVEAAAPGEPPRIVAVAEGMASDLARWRAEKLFARSRAVLVLRAEERQLLTLDRPDVPDDELARAVRWPLGEALEIEPDQLLSAALPMPRINEALRPQVLAVASRLDLVRGHLKLLSAAGIDVRSIDVADGALRGMRLLQPADADGWVMLALVGSGVSIGLLWQDAFCALRTMALPEHGANIGQEYAEQLALQIQRTADLFERQATRLAIRRLVAALPALATEASESVRSVLPLRAQLFDLGASFSASSDTLQRCARDNELTALACVAAARLFDAGVMGPRGALPADSAEEGKPAAEAAVAADVPSLELQP